jgi:Tol biopolymer transport system component
MPATLAKTTAHLASTPAEAGSAPFAPLAQEVLKVMFLQKLKVTLLPLFVIIFLTAGAVTMARQATQSTSKEPRSTAAARGKAQPSAVTLREPTGRIYFATEYIDPQSKARVCSLIALDPKTGAKDYLFDGCSIRPRISPDGLTVAYQSEGSLWVRCLDKNSQPKRIMDMDGATSGSPPNWSADGKQLVISLGHNSREQRRSPWVFKTVRVNVDGSGREELPIPPEDGVHDWSRDGRWFLTASGRGAKFGWQLYVMKPDGQEVRRITTEGNPFYARFSPDGRRVLYTDGARPVKSGIWVVDANGGNRRLIYPLDSTTKASACWSLDGKRIAVSLVELPIVLPLVNLPLARNRPPVRIVVMDLDGGPPTEIVIPDGGHTDMPDWR